MSTKQSSSAFHYQPSSPLETLVRRTSAKRANTPAVKTQSPSSLSEGSSPQYFRQNDAPQSYYHHDGLSTPPRQTHGRPLVAPPSPLLHSRFARDSVTTTDSANASSYLDLSIDERSRDSVDSRNVYQEGVDYNYEESVYSTDTALRDSWQSAGTAWQSEGSGPLRYLNQGARPEEPLTYPTHSQSHQFHNDSATAVPTVVVTEHEYPDPEPPMDSIRLKQAEKAPITPLAHNFSRPIRPSAVPVLMPAEEEKRKVMERNAGRKPRQPGQSHEMSHTPTSSHLPSPHSPRSPGDYFGSHQTSGAPSEYHRSQSPHYPRSSPHQPSTPRTPQVYASNTHPAYRPNSPSKEFHQSSPSISHPYPSPSSSRPTSPSAYPMYEQSRDYRVTAREASLSPTPSHQSRSGSPIISSTPTNLPHSPSKVVLPRRPPSLRPGSPASLYSRYSFYQLDSPSPNGTTHFTTDLDPEKQQRKNSQSSMMLDSSKPPNEPETKAHHFLQLGIQHHEANRLKESAICFEKSANEDGGCGAGMLMFGLTLRHGWGCEKNEKVGFKWLRKAAENAVADLESARNGGGIDQGAVRAELILAIYEVGQCFFHGWGVPKDQKMAVSYYRVAARLGDADAQNDLGFCLANGKGCKKDRKEAAKWYRAAVEQGQSDVGLAWIYKEKFQ
ncbi:hypothetical protein E1B28_009756 [Marasmius oreades]|uniref:HCP-like protein n=1 Tax=Marasmius oreades TaxID=181124 RepID=A0A9P7RVV6_9AGAR|nr:uncharacterized protein E1B28_009756 [Marasmius oreades]KAG7090657.1 hypothetical protein E1B28_009756 [Marasmius oreades]